LNTSFLSNYKVIMFFDNLPGDANQRTAFQTYMTNGGGWIGYHVSAFNQNPSSWDWYFNKFLAMGSFMTNTWPPSAPLLLVEDTLHPATKGLGTTFKPEDNEWYSWQNDLRKNADIKILCSIDKSAYPVGTQGVFTWNGTGYVPVVWTNKNYKMLYMNMGHNRDGDVGVSTTFTNANIAKLILNTIKWLGGVTTDIGTDEPVSRRVPIAPAGTTVAISANAISISYGVSVNTIVTVSDTSGRVLVKTLGTKGNCRIDRSAFTPGLYIVRIANSQGSVSRRFYLE
jgi:type 1 glutamine amidotransferase